MLYCIIQKSIPNEFTHTHTHTHTHTDKCDYENYSYIMLSTISLSVWAKLTACKLILLTEQDLAEDNCKKMKTKARPLPVPVQHIWNYVRFNPATNNINQVHTCSRWHRVSGMSRSTTISWTKDLLLMMMTSIVRALLYVFLINRLTLCFLQQ